MKHLIAVLSLLVAAAAAACQPLPSVSPAIAPPPTAAATQAPSASAGTGPAVAFVKDGRVLIWDEATGETQTLFDAGDAIGVSASDDGQVLAFLRRSVVQLAQAPWTHWRKLFQNPVLRLRIRAFAMMAGKVSRAEPKMMGMTPAWFTRSGR